MLPPSLAQLVSYTDDFTSFSVSVFHQLLIASGWDNGDGNAIRVANGENPSYTMLVPPDDALSRVPPMDPEWSRHRKALLDSLVSSELYAQSDLMNLAENIGGERASMQMLDGTTRDVSLDSNSKLLIGGAPIYEPYDIRAVDGYVISKFLTFSMIYIPADHPFLLSSIIQLPGSLGITSPASTFCCGFCPRLGAFESQYVHSCQFYSGQ